MAQADDRQRTRRARTDRLRQRIAQIKPIDGDMLSLRSVLLGILDMIDDEPER